jgi:hypothetical protein
LESSVCFFCWILIIFTSILFFSLLLVGGYHRLFYIFVMPVSSMCMQTSNFIDAAFSILLQVKAFFFFSSLIFLFVLSGLVVLLCAQFLFFIILQLCLADDIQLLVFFLLIRCLASAPSLLKVCYCS